MSGAKPHLKPTAAELWPNLSAGDTAHQAASLTDRAMMRWQPMPGSADADLIPELPIIAPRSRDLGRNNPLASSALQTQRDNIIGSVLRLSAKPDAETLGWNRDSARDWSRTTESTFRTWADTTECDAGRTQTLIGLTLQILTGAMLNGDGLALPLWRPRPGDRWQTKLLVIESDRLATPPGMESRSDIRGGCEIDADGAPLAYWIRKTHPGDGYGWLGFGSFAASAAEDFERVAAFTPWGRRRVIHLHDRERAGQNRGKPVFTAVMREFRMLGEYAGAELQAALANALIAAFLESNLDQESSARLFSSGADKNPASYWRSALGEYRTNLRSGAIIPLPTGAKLSSFNPGRPNTAFDGFVTKFEQYLGAGLNLPRELLTKDFSQSNYSSARAALLEAWRYFKGRRRWLEDLWLRPVYELWMEEAVNTGQVEAPTDWYLARYAYLRGYWTFAGRGWVDPVKEAQAAQIRMEIGISTLEQECAEQGLDWEEVLEQRAYEIARLEELGLSAADTAAVLSVPAPTDTKRSAAEE